MSEQSITLSVLFADDNMALAQECREWFNHHGWDAEAVDSGQGCLERIKAREFDAIVLDMRMPKMDGFQTLQLLLQERPDACVLFYTGFGDAGAAVKALQQGAVTLLEKPMKPAILQELVKQAIGHKRNELGNRALKRNIYWLTLKLADYMNARLSDVEKQLDSICTNQKRDELNPVDIKSKVSRLLKIAGGVMMRIKRWNDVSDLTVGPINVCDVVMNAISRAKIWHCDETKLLRGVDVTEKRLCVSYNDVSGGMAFANRDFIEEALACVIQNALREDPSGVTVSCKREGETYKLIVRDGGGGFPPGMRPDEPFVSGDPKTRIGLGLTLAKRIVKSCGGKLEYGNRTDGHSGAEVRIVLRAADGYIPPHCYVITE